MFEPTTSSGPPGAWEVSLQMPLLLDSSEVAWPAEGTIAPTTAADTVPRTAACSTSTITMNAARVIIAIRNALVWARLVAADPASPATGAPMPVLPTARAVAAPIPEAATSWAPPVMSPLRAFWAPRRVATATSEPVAFLTPNSAPCWARTLPVLGASATGDSSVSEPRSPEPGPSSASSSGAVDSPVSWPGREYSSVMGNPPRCPQVGGGATMARSQAAAHHGRGLGGEVEAILRVLVRLRWRRLDGRAVISIFDRRRRLGDRGDQLPVGFLPSCRIRADGLVVGSFPVRLDGRAARFRIETGRVEPIDHRGGLAQRGPGLAGDFGDQLAVADPDLGLFLQVLDIGHHLGHVSGCQLGL